MSDFSIGSLLDDDKRASLQNFSENLPTTPLRVQAEAPRSKRDIVSRVAYLIGIDGRYFGLEQTENMNPQFYRSVYDEMNSDKEARIVRNLCRLRTKLQRNFRAIYTEMNSDIKNLDSIPDLVPQDALKTLEQDGIPFVRAKRRLEDYIVGSSGHTSATYSLFSAATPSKATRRPRDSTTRPETSSHTRRTSTGILTRETEISSGMTQSFSLYSMSATGTDSTT